MNQAQAAELIELLGQILQALVRIEKIMTPEFGPAARQLFDELARPEVYNPRRNER